MRRICAAQVDYYSPMKPWGVLALGIATGLAAATADLPLQASLTAAANKHFISISERSIVVSLVLTNTGQRPLAIVRSSLGMELRVEYTPELDDSSRKPMTWAHSTLTLPPESGEPSMLPASAYELVAPGKEYRTEVEAIRYLRGLPPEGLKPGVYLVSFSYSYEPNSAEQSLPLIRRVAASEPVRITVGARLNQAEDQKQASARSAPASPRDPSSAGRPRA